VDARIVDQLDVDLGSLPHATGDGLVEPEHGVARTVFVQREDRRTGGDDLSDLQRARADRPGVGHAQLGVGEGLLGEIEPGLRSGDRARGRRLIAYRVVELHLRGDRVGVERLLATELQVRPVERRRRRDQRRLGDGDVRLLLLRVEPGEHRSGRHVVADVDEARHHLAARLEGEVALDAGVDVAGGAEGRLRSGALQAGHVDQHRLVRRRGGRVASNPCQTGQ
jgi:hypothetical protein